MKVRRALPPLLAVVLAAPALAGCQLIGGGSHLDDALEVVPGDTAALTFTDRAAMAERLGVDDIGSGADDDEISEYAEATRTDPVGGTPLAQYLVAMDDAAFSELDVVWAVQTTSPNAPTTTVYKVDDVDLDQLVSDLEDAGMDGEESDGRTLLSAPSPTAVVDDSGLVGGSYPLEFGLGTLVDPDEDLVATGGDLEAVVDVLDDDEDSLTDAGTFDDLADGVDDVELAYLADDPPCGGGRATQEQIEASGSTTLGSPTAVGYFVSGDGDDAVSSGRFLFDDDEAAESDLDARRTYAEDGRSFRTGEPLSDLGSAELEQDGAVVTMELDLENPANGRRMALDADAFFACAP